MSRPSRTRAIRPLRTVAITGTPGTGKSTVARRLALRFAVHEVGPSGRASGASVRSDGGWLVDLSRLSRQVARPTDPGPPDLWVGHLAHLLPIRDVVVLRCHPIELLRRLRSARRGTRATRSENVMAEATDLILIEAASLGRTIYEIDTTGRTPEAIAAQVARVVGGRVRPRHGELRWLEDRDVTERLFPRLWYEEAWSRRGTGRGRRRTSRGSARRSSGGPRIG